MKRSDTQYSYVCANKWNDEYSDVVCNKLGFSHAIKWAKIKIFEENARYLTVDGDDVENEQIINHFNFTEKCDDDEIVALDCQLYSKFNEV